MRARLSLLLLVLLTGGCLWRGYDRVVEVHLEVLESMSVKMCALTSGPAPASESMGEFVYPGKRAREAERHFASRAGRPSFGGLVRVTERYENLVVLFDRARVNPEAWTAGGPRVCDESRALVAEVQAVRAQLASEG